MYKIMLFTDVKEKYFPRAELTQQQKATITRWLRQHGFIVRKNKDNVRIVEFSNNNDLPKICPIKFKNTKYESLNEFTEQNSVNRILYKPHMKRILLKDYIQSYHNQEVVPNAWGPVSRRLKELGFELIKEYGKTYILYDKEHPLPKTFPLKIKAFEPEETPARIISLPSKKDDEIIENVVEKVSKSKEEILLTIPVEYQEAKNMIDVLYTIIELQEEEHKKELQEMEFRIYELEEEIKEINTKQKVPISKPSEKVMEILEKFEIDLSNISKKF